MMYQNLDGTQKKSKTPLIIIVTLFIVITIVGATSVIFKNQQNDNKEPNEYKEENNSHLNSNEEEKETEEEKQDEPSESVPKQEESTPSVEDTNPQENYNNIEQLTYDSFQNMIKDKRSFVVVISQTYCSHCIAYKPIYNEVLKQHNSKGYDLDILNLDKEKRQEILDTLDVPGTPTTLIFIDGVLQRDRIEGITTEEELEKFFAKYGFI